MGIASKLDGHEAAAAARDAAVALLTGQLDDTRKEFYHANYFGTLPRTRVTGWCFFGGAPKMSPRLPAL